jgi:hypothetical protein
MTNWRGESHKKLESVMDIKKDEIVSVSSMMNEVVELTRSVLAGRMDPKLAATGLRGYSLAFRGADLMIQGARLDNDIRKDLPVRLGVLHERKELSAAEPVALLAGVEGAGDAV